MAWPATGNAAASLVTTAGDYARFLAATLRGEGLQPRQRRGVVYFANGVNGLAIAHRLLAPLTTEAQPGLDWLRYGR